MIEEREVREMLQRRADTIPAPPVDTPTAVRRARRRLALNSAVAAVAAVAIAVATFAGIEAIRSAPIPVDDPTPNPAPSADLGVFAPVAGWIVYGDRDGIWGVDPGAPADHATRVQLTSEAGSPLGWSSDGTRLLILQQIRGERVVSQDRDALRLSVLNAEGSETLVAERQAWITGATISPDGSHVVFATYEAIYSVEVGGGRPIVLAKDQSYAQAPTFSPDGAKIAYIIGSGDHSHSVWVMDADGTDAHQILANETTMGAGHVYGLAWSPTGDRIAFGNDVATYTFAPDGSGFTRVIANGNRPSWSPDGSQLAYIVRATVVSRALSRSRTPTGRTRENLAS